MAHTHACESCGEHYTCDAPMERNDDGWPNPVCVTRKESDNKFRWCLDCYEGRLPCDTCDGKRRGTFNDVTGEVTCEDCEQARAEAAHERMMEDYYGGSGPQTINEQYQAAVRQRRELRRRD